MGWVYSQCGGIFDAINLQNALKLIHQNSLLAWNLPSSGGIFKFDDDIHVSLFFAVTSLLTGRNNSPAGFAPRTEPGVD
jgi:hypothetical protein